MSGPEAPAGSVYADIFEALEAAGAAYAGATDKGGLWTCPVHEDDRASLAVDVGTRRPLFYCFPCCGDGEPDRRADFLDALWALGVPREAAGPTEAADVDWGDPAPTYERTRGGKVVGGKPVAAYYYKNADGSPNFKIDRIEGEDGTKRFVASRWDSSHGGYRAGGIEDVLRTPLHFNRFEDWALEHGSIYLVEGEKAAGAIYAARRPVTTFAFGTSSPLPDDWTRWFIDFKEVRIWPDADEVGVKMARARYAELQEAGVNAVFWGIGAGEAEPTDDAFDALARGQKGRRLTEADLDALAALKPAAAPFRARREGEKPLVSAVPWSGGSGASRAAYGVPHTVNPGVFAAEYLERLYTDGEGLLTLRFADGRFWLWEGTHFRPLTEDEMKAKIRRDLEDAEETLDDGSVRELRLKRSSVGEVLDAVVARTLVSRHGGGELLPATGGVPFSNGWLDVATGALEPLTPARDIRWVVPGDYDPEAAAPRAWFKFLDSIGWGKGSEERRLLRQWFGYVLSGATDQQKALMLIGPARAGKGTILGTLEAMLGEGAVGLDLGAFSTQFGLSSAVGKGLATVGDARFEMRTDKGLIRRILSMVGEDTITIDRKHKEPLSVRIGARLVIASNELPAVIEASNAFASRFLFLRLTQTFLGREDRTLRNAILAELPGIVRWALGGLADLEAEGRFTETADGIEMGHEMAAISNPIRVFIEEECTLDPEGFTPTSRLHEEYALWAESRRFYVPDQGVFARDLNAAFPDSQIQRVQRKWNGKNARGFAGVRI